MQYRLLGPVEVWDGDRRVDLGRAESAKARCVLAALLRDPGELVTSETLAERVWGDNLPGSAVRYKYVGWLRAALAPDLRVSSWLLAGVALLGAATSAGAILAWLRGLERADPSQDAPPVDQAEELAMARAEDHTVQNHMISLVHVKPGILRAVLVRAGLWGLGYILRVTARNGYLASMRTIHFAHWALISNGGRLMFHSNYDSSWESYLDDFIEKANVGLTLAWTNAVGFPATRFLIFGGASQGRKFKAWARHSMTESGFWFSAYKALTVNQVERQARLADGLRRPCS